MLGNRNSRQSSGSSNSRGYGDGYTTPESVYEKDMCESLLARTVSEDSLPKAQRLILGKLIDEVFAAKLRYEQNGGAMSRITLLEESNSALTNQIEHLNATFSQEIHELHLAVNRLEATLHVLQGETL